MNSSEKRQHTPGRCRNVASMKSRTDSVTCCCYCRYTNHLKKTESSQLLPYLTASADLQEILSYHKSHGSMEDAITSLLVAQQEEGFIPHPYDPADGAESEANTTTPRYIPYTGIYPYTVYRYRIPYTVYRIPYTVYRIPYTVYRILLYERIGHREITTNHVYRKPKATSRLEWRLPI